MMINIKLSFAKFLFQYFRINVRTADVAKGEAINKTYCLMISFLILLEKERAKGILMLALCQIARL